MSVTLPPIPEQYGDFMVCPYTGLSIPKSLPGNLAWRRKMLGAAKTSESTRRALKKAASSSPIFWTNLFAWTFLQKAVGDDGQEGAVFGENAHVPFITWKVQDEAIQKLVDAI